MQVDLVRPGRASLAWLSRCVAELKCGDPLQPITIVVPNHVLGRFIGRQLGRTAAVVNVRAVRLEDVALTVLGGPSEIPNQLTPSLELGAARSAVDSAGGGLRTLAHHYPLYQELLRLFRELRRQDVQPDALAELPHLS